MEDVELRVLHSVQQHVHASEVVGGDVFLLAVDFADGTARLVHFLADVEQQRAGAAGEVHHTVQPLLGHAFLHLGDQLRSDELEFVITHCFHGALVGGADGFLEFRAA